MNGIQIYCCKILQHLASPWELFHGGLSLWPQGARKQIGEMQGEMIIATVESWYLQTQKTAPSVLWGYGAKFQKLNQPESWSDPSSKWRNLRAHPLLLMCESREIPPEFLGKLLYMLLIHGIQPSTLGIS